MNTSQYSQDSLAQSVLGDSTMMELGMDSLGRQPSLAKGFKSTGWDPFNNDGAVHSVTKMKKGKKGRKKSSKKMKAIELAKRGYERHMRQLEADKRRDRNLRMARSVYRRMESRERLATRQKERLALQQYCSQPLLYVMDPGVELKVTQPIPIGRAIQSRAGAPRLARTKPQIHPATLESMRAADMRAASKILERFEADDEHERVEAARRRYKKSLKRGELTMKAEQRNALEERLGTPFAKTRLRKLRRSRMLASASSPSLGGTANAESLKPGGSTMMPPSSAPSGPQHHRMVAQRGRQGAKSMGGLRDGTNDSGLGDNRMVRAQTAQGNLYGQGSPGMIVSNTVSSVTGSAMSTHGHHGAQDKLPVWKRQPVAHHELPERSGSFQIRKLLSNVKSRKKRKKRGFAVKRIYPTEVAGLDTLFL
eukprot:g7105.t1